MKKNASVFKDYEEKRLKSYVHGMYKSMKMYISIEYEIPEGQRESISQLLVDIQESLSCAKSILANLSAMNGFSLWLAYKPLHKLCGSILGMCESNLLQKSRS